MAGRTPDLAVDRLRKDLAVHVQGELVPICQGHLKPLRGVTAKTLLDQFGERAVGRAGGMRGQENSPGQTEQRNHHQ